VELATPAKDDGDGLRDGAVSSGAKARRGDGGSSAAGFSPFVQRVAAAHAHKVAVVPERVPDRNSRRVAIVSECHSPWFDIPQLEPDYDAETSLWNAL